MATIHHGRRTHAHEGPVTVLLIGMRLNRLRKVRSWAPVVKAMPAMLQELAQDPQAGFLRHRTYLSGRTILVVQYWRSAEDIYRYAVDAERLHRPAWKAYNKAIRKRPGDVGVWHETYMVPAGHHETIYVDMPVIGLAAATESIQVRSGQDSARQRMAAR